MKARRISWTDLKTWVSANSSINKNYIEQSNKYVVSAWSNQLSVETVLPKNESNADTTDFENNFQSTWRQTFPAVTGNNEIIVNVPGGAGQGCPVFSNKFVGDHSETNINLTGSLASIYTYNGSGKLAAFVLDFNSNNVEVQLKVDGNEVFKMTLGDIQNLQSFNSGGCDNTGGNQQFMPLSVTSGSRVNFNPDCPIEYGTSVVINARETSGSRRLDRRIIWLTKET